MVLKALQPGDLLETLKIVRNGASVKRYDPQDIGLVQNYLGVSYQGCDDFG